MEASSTEPDKFEKFESVSFNENPAVLVKEIVFEGLERSNEKFLLDAISDLYTIDNLHNLSTSLNQAFSRLERLNVFKEVSVLIDEAAIDSEAQEEAPSHPIKLVFKCKEKRFNIRTGTEFQRRDIAWNFGGKFFNVFGRAESLEINSSLGANSSTPFSLNFTKPIQGTPDKLVFLNASQFKDNFLNGCKWRHDSKNSSFGFQYLPGPSSKHEVKYLAEWRRLFDVQSGASHEVRNLAGSSVKSSLIHTWTHSSRDDSALPTKGNLLRVSNEFAGLGGSAHFLKTEFLFQNHFTPLFFTLTNSIKFGYIHSILNTGKNTSFIPIPDRFQMGGPASIRGFPSNSLGPRQFSDALGGSAILEAGLQVSFPIIQSIAHIVRGHGFVNAGLLGDHQSFGHAKSLLIDGSSKNLEQLHPNISVGGGFMFKMAESIRLELNFAVPVLKQKGLEQDRGIQVGIGIEFL